MARIIGIDYGTKRVGLAVTDPLQIIASPLETVETAKIFDYLSAYLAAEEVETIVVGEPFYLDGNPAQIHHLVMAFAELLRVKFPSVKVAFVDERNTSNDAKKIILQSGIGKQKRRDKSLVDKVSASLILHEYMNWR